MATVINYAPLCRNVEELIKKRLKQLGLVKTGALLDSIVVTYKNNSFQIEALDYFEYLDEKHDISYYVFSSDEFINLMADLMVEEIEKKI